MVAGVQHAVTTTLARCHCARSLGAASQDTDGNGEVTFVEFKVWWDENGGELPPLTSRQDQTEPGSRAETGERSVRADSRSCAWRAGKASKKSETPAGTIDLKQVTDVRAGLAGTKDAGILYIDIPGRTCVTP